MIQSVCVCIWLNPCLLGPFGRGTTTGDEDNCRTVYFVNGRGNSGRSWRNIQFWYSRWPDYCWSKVEEMETFVRIICLWQRSNECKTKESSSPLWGTANAGCVFYVPSRSSARWGRNCFHSCNWTAGPALYFPGKCSVEQHNFRMISHLPTEFVDQFVTRMREKNWIRRNGR